MGNTVSNEAALLAEDRATDVLEESTSGVHDEEESPWDWEAFLHRPFTQVLMLDEPSAAAYVQTLPLFRAATVAPAR
jgi:hypothetical protein